MRQPSLTDRNLPGQKGRISELDGLRGMAILMVLFFHYFESAPLPRYLSAVGQMTWTAIDLFFVLSGFLIGGILLENRTSPNYFKTFYIRRAYRILPLYIVITASFWFLTSLRDFDNYNAAFRWLFSDPPAWYWYASITQNFAMTFRGTLDPAWLGVTWSLGVEEQFYLTLPLVIRYVSPRRLPYVLCAFIAAAPVIRFALRLFYAHGDIAGYILMPCRADALMLGVGAALIMRNDRARQFLANNKRLLYGMLVLLTCGMVWMGLKAAGLRHEYDPSPAEAAAQSALHQSRSLWVSVRPYARMAVSSLNYTWIDFFYLCLLFIAITQRSSLLTRLFRNRLLLAAGMISYAAYYFHQPVQGLFYGFTRGYVPKVRILSDAGITALSLVLTIVLASLSWLYFEKPLLRRGHRYRYEAGKASESATGLQVAPAEVTAGEQ
jgi:peptidoglycan/LPS O-acetylase OafA/YrhL